MSAESERKIAMLEAGMCPECGKGPFRVVLRHINAAHDIPRRDYKLQLGLGLRGGFAAPDLAEQRRGMANRLHAEGKLLGQAAGLSPEQKAKRKETVKASAAFQRAARNNGELGRVIRSRAAVERHLLARALWDGGKGPGAIAAEMGVGREVVRRALHGHKGYSTGESLRRRPGASNRAA